MAGSENLGRERTAQGFLVKRLCPPCACGKAFLVLEGKLQRECRFCDRQLLGVKRNRTSAIFLALSLVAIVALSRALPVWAAFIVVYPFVVSTVLRAFLQPALAPGEVRPDPARAFSAEEALQKVPALERAFRLYLVIVSIFGVVVAAALAFGAAWT